jgi:hypothetical protein
LLVKLKKPTPLAGDRTSAIQLRLQIPETTSSLRTLTNYILSLLYRSRFRRTIEGLIHSDRFGYDKKIHKTQPSVFLEITFKRSLVTLCFYAVLQLYVYTTTSWSRNVWILIQIYILYLHDRIRCGTDKSKNQTKCL